MSVKSILYNLVPHKIRCILKVRARFFLLRKSYREKKAIARIAKKEKINVVFFAMSVSLWKYDSLYAQMLKNSRFNLLILLAPSTQDANAVREKNIQQMRLFFQEKKYRFAESLEGFEPDILFYAQPYRDSQPAQYAPLKFLDKLICYVPYSFFISNYNWCYDLLFHNLAWKLFYPTLLHKKNAEEISLNKGQNVEVVGYSLYDQFYNKKPTKDIWKIQDKKIKRFIWAAHFSVLDNSDVNCSTFLKYASSMYALAKNNPQYQFAFKPHPHLRRSLYLHPDYGVEKTEAYFKAWDDLPNGILAEGDYIDLFLTSDALIHDCGSFTVEYLYMQKPVLYIGNERDEILCHFGREAMQANYTTKDFSVQEFIHIFETQKDFKKAARAEILQKHLIPPHEKSFTENILAVLERELKF